MINVYYIKFRTRLAQIIQSLFSSLDVREETVDRQYIILYNIILYTIFTAGINANYDIKRI